MIGRERVCRPVAWKTALAMVAAMPTRPISPIPEALSSSASLPSESAYQEGCGVDGTSAVPGRVRLRGMTTLSYSSSFTPLASAASLRVRSWSMA